MPVREISGKWEVAGEAALCAELKDELDQPKDSGEPEIIIDRPNPSTSHLFVIWSKWENLEQMVRSRIIFDAYTAAKGEAEAVKVTVAMGLTPPEAERLGLQ